MRDDRPPAGNRRDPLAQIAARLGGHPEPATDEVFEERAAIFEFEAGLPRPVAERFARRLAALGSDPSPELLRLFDRDITAEERRHRIKAAR